VAVSEQEYTEEQIQEADRRGMSVEEMVAQQAESGDDTEDDGTPQLVIPGTGPKLSGSVGGKRPTESQFKMASISLPISGNMQLEKDEELWVAVQVAVDDVKVRNRRKGKEIVAVVRTHTAIPLGAPIILDGPPGGYEEE
jgi:hypothetical protein